MDLFGSAAAADEDLDRPAVVAMDKEVVEAWPVEPESETLAVPEPSREIEPAAEDEIAPEAETKGVKDFPEVKGLSVSEGMAWADGNPRLFLKALREFAQQHAGTGDKIRAALEQGDAADAEQLARGLKNSAGEIGAATLAESATALARAIHDRAEPVDLEAAWTEAETQLHDLLIELKAVTKPKEEKPAPARRLPAPPPLDAAQLRKAMSLILPLLVDRDPGAKDCLKDNRNTFRSGFTAEGYADFEQAIKKGDFDVALESLKKAARKNGIPF
jgi:HPt (histidine-containing phosphotransfer) domain-containing protein